MIKMPSTSAIVSTPQRNFAAVKNNPYTPIAMNNNNNNGIIQCESCAHRLHELQRQAMKYLMMEIQKMVIFCREVLPIETLFALVFQQLDLPNDQRTGVSNGACVLCHTRIETLFKHAVSTLNTVSIAPYLPRLTEKRNSQLINEKNKDNLMEPRGTDANSDVMVQNDIERNNYSNGSSEIDGNLPTSNPVAALFFARAAKKLNITGKKKIRPNRPDEFIMEREEPQQLFPTNFSKLLQERSPPNPPGLLRYMGRRVDGKVKVMLRIAPNQTKEKKEESFLHIDERRKQVNVVEPKTLGDNHISARVQNSPKLFAYDSIYDGETGQSKVAGSAVLDVLHAVINGGDGCLVAFGAGGLGKTETMVGNDSGPETLGAIPNALAWLYNLIEDKKQRTGTRFSVRISAVEIVGASENLRDLLSEQASCGSSTNSIGTSPGIYLRDDIAGGLQISNVSELRAATAEKAAFFLDAALASRTTVPSSLDDANEDLSELQGSHMLFTVHVYQHRIPKNEKVHYTIDGGRSRLHLIDLSALPRGFNRQAKTNSAPSQTALGNVLVALLNNVKAMSHRHCKIARLLKESLGKPTCRTTVIAHVSDDVKKYSETMSTIQLVSRILRSRRRRNKVIGPGESPLSATASSSEGNTSCDDSYSGRQFPRPARVLTYGIDDSANESGNDSCSPYGPRGYPSSAGEDSCDTVIYCGPDGQLSDRDLTDNEGPPTDPDPLKHAIEQLKKCDAELEQSSKEEEFIMTNLCEDEFLLPRTEEPKRRLPPPIKTKPKIESESCKQSGKPCVVPQPKPELKKVDIIDNCVKEMEKVKNQRNEVKAAIPVARVIGSRRGSDAAQIEEDEFGYFEMGPVTEKELRRKERRIAKLLKQKSFDDKGNLIKSDGYKSECEAERAKSRNRKQNSDKTDGYTSAPETEPRLRILDVKLRKEVMKDMKSIKALDEENNDDEADKRLSAVFTERLLNNFVTQQLVVERRKSQIIPDDLDIGCAVTLPLTDRNSLKSAGHMQSDEHRPVISRTLSEQPPKADKVTSKSRSLSDSATAHSVLNSLSNRPGDENESSYAGSETSSVSNYEPYSLYADGSTRRRGPAKLAYRWSTVLEEEDTKKQPIRSPKVSREMQHKDFSHRKSSNETVTSKHSKNNMPYVDTKSHIHNSRSSVSGCSDTSSSSGVVSNGSSSPSQQSLHHTPGLHQYTTHGTPVMDSRRRALTDPSPKAPRRWFFSRERRERKPKTQPRIVSGYTSEGSYGDLRRSSWRHSRFFGSKSRLSSSNGGNCSGYESSRTDGGLSNLSGNESACESVSGSTKKRKKKFLGFRRRSLSDLTQKSRSKRSYWIDTKSRFPDMEDDSTEYRVYEIEDTSAMTRKQQKTQQKRFTTSEGCIPFKVNPALIQLHRRQVADLEKQKNRLAREVNTAMDQLMLDRERCAITERRLENPDDPNYAKELMRDVGLYKRRLDALKCHLQVVTCFDKPKQSRSTTI